MSPRNISEGIFENFQFRGHLPPKKLKIEGGKQVPYSDQPTPHRTHFREIVFTQHCSSKVREFFRSVNIFVRRTVLELRCITSPVLEFCLFFPHKSLKSIFLYVAYSPGLDCRMTPVITCNRGRFRGVPFGSNVFWWHLVVELGPTKLDLAKERA